MAEGKQIPLQGLITPDDTFAPAERALAVKKINDIQASAIKFGKFGKFTAGTEKTAKLENDVLSLSFSTKGASISRAELKKYITQYSPDETKKVKNPVVLFEGASNNLSFILPVNNEVSTSELYFDILAQELGTFRSQIRGQCVLGHPLYNQAGRRLCGEHSHRTAGHGPCAAL